ncbi:MAG: radical SAM/SPASM domain-containing protein [Bacilli bacterium]
MNEPAPKHFKRVYIEITNVCQLSCAFCLPLKRPIRFMNEQEFVRILREIKPYTDYLYLHVKGEPLLHPNLEGFLDLALEHKFQVNLTTNGLLIDAKQVIISTHPAVRQINVSLHALQKIDENERLSYVNKLISFLRIMENTSGKYVSLRFWLGNNHLKSFVIEHLNQAFNVSLDNESKNLFPHVYINTDQEFVWPEQSMITSPFAFCHGLKDHFAILVDGSVVPCCLDGNGQINLGNIFDHSFLEIMNNKEWKSLKKAFQERQNIPKLCQYCSYKNRFAR